MMRTKLSALSTVVLAIVAMTMIACSDGPTEVVVPPVVRVDVTPGDQVLVVGDTLRLTAHPRMADGGIRGDVAIEWRSMGTGVASVEADGAFGRVRAIAVGTARIEAESEGKIGYVTVTVVATPAPVVTWVQILPAYVELDIGQTHLLQAVAKAVDGSVIENRQVTWTSAWSPMASIVGNGDGATATVTAHASGLVTMRASVDGVVGEALVRVRVPEVPVGAVIVNPAHRSIWQGTTVSYADGVRVLSQNGLPLEGRPVTWSTEDARIATVDEHGTVTGISAGTTRVLATSGGQVGRALITVYALPQGNAVYDLTYDWWDGEFKLIEKVGLVPWTDASGVEHQLPLYVTGGTLTLTDAGTYERRLELKASAVVNGSNEYVYTREEIDRGNVFIKIGGETGYDLVSTTTPGYRFEAVGWYNAGHLLVRQVIGTAQLTEYLFRLGQ